MPLYCKNKKITKKTESKIKNVITTISALWVLTLFYGVMFLLSDDATFNAIGKYMTFIPLSIMVLSLVLLRVEKAVSVAEK